MKDFFELLDRHPDYIGIIGVVVTLFIIWQILRLIMPSFSKNADNNSEVSHGLVDIMGKSMVQQQGILEALANTQNRQIEVLEAINKRHESNTGKLDVVGEGIKKLLEQDTAQYSTIDLTLTTVMEIHKLLLRLEREIPGAKAILNLISERIYQVHKLVAKMENDTQPIPINIIEDIQKLASEFENKSTDNGQTPLSPALV